MRKFHIVLVVLLCWRPAAVAASLEQWQGAWGHPATAYNDRAGAARSDGTVANPVYAALPPYSHATVREVVRLSASARKIRLRFSNEFGAGSLHIGAAHIALAAEDGTIVPGTDHVVTFTGQGGVDIPPGAPMLSDPLSWSLPEFTRLAVSVYYPTDAPAPAHTLFTLDAWQAAGDHTADAGLSTAKRARSGVHLSEVDIVPVRSGNTVVTFGDSVTEGVMSTVGAFRAWPDRLAERLQANPSTRNWSVVNAGIGSNRLLHDTPSVNALARFDRDVLSVPGAKAVIVLLGINDIQYSHRNAAEAVRAPQEIAAFRQLIDRAHAAGLKIFGATITPFEGSADYTPDGEADRQAMNAFVRSGAFDGVVDFDAALRDPARPEHLRADTESGGHLHPNDQGYRLMGDSIDLGLFR
ncbi:MAG TPA: SGNH/GDSL hydrolase family protein [Rhizomicrobium sp.]|nr:SGNH/GDSL hydrolase family protein [Rhizomicrobium sp.]